MKVIAISQEQFYEKPQHAMAEISRVLNSSVDSPVFINHLSELLIKKDVIDLSLSEPLILAEYLNNNLQLPILKCHKILTEASQGVLVLDLTGLSLGDAATMAQLFAKTAFELHHKPKAYLLLVNELSGADIAEFWYKAFYIEPYPAHLLSLYLNRSLFRMRLRAFVLRYFGGKGERILRRLWHLSQKIRRR